MSCLQVKYYEGYIRNWKSLCSQLGLELTLSRKERETAIIAAGYEAWGSQLGNHLCGNFVFAIWDEEKEELFCARDQFGTKTFYYYLTKDNDLLYSASIPEIINMPGFEKELDHAALQVYLTFGYMAGEHTLLKGVTKLQPGCYILKNKDGMKIDHYWKANFEPDYNKTAEEWADLIHTTMQKVFAEEIENNQSLRVGSFLSGGVDSSYLLSMSDATCAYTIGYEDQAFDESSDASATAELLKKDFSRRVVGPEEYFDMIPWVMEHMGQPLGDASAITFAIGCKSVTESNDICYSGEGADEFFAGYNSHRNAPLLAQTPEKAYLGCTSIMREDFKSQLYKQFDPSVVITDLVKDLYYNSPIQENLSNMLSVDIGLYLEGDIYLNVDRMSVANGLEVHMPISDQRIFNVARQIPMGMKIHDEINKYVFRKAGRNMLPEHIAFRKKVGFPVPVRKWMSDPAYNGVIYEALISEDSALFFDQTMLQNMWDEFTGGNDKLWRILYALYVFLVWYRIYFH